jgi:hypothetical protein
MLSRGVACAILASCGAFVVSCGSGTYVPDESSGARLGAFGRVVVDPFTVALPESVSEVKRKEAELMAAVITDRVRRRLSETKAFEAEGPTLRIQGEISGFDPGSQFLRWFIGFGAGSGEVLARVRFDGEEGAALSKGTARGTVWCGFMGGTIDEAAKRLADALVGFLRASRSEAVESGR